MIRAPTYSQFKAPSEKLLFDGGSYLLLMPKS